MFRDIRNMSLSTLAAFLLLALRSVLVLKIVGPTTIGVWKSVLVLFFIAEFANLGLPHGILLRVPLLLGQRRDREIKLTAEAAGSFLSLIGLALGTAVFLASFLASNADYRLAMRLVAVVMALSQPYHLLRELAVSRHLFSVRIKETLIDAVTNFAATMVLASLFGLAGLGIAAILTVVVPFVYLSWRLEFRVKPRLDVACVKGLVKTGLPYSLNEASVHVVRYLTVGLVALLLGPTEAGYFALSLLIIDFSANVTETGLMRVVSPHMQREFGRAGSLKEVAGYYEAPVRLFCYALPPVLALGGLCIPAAVEFLLPRYAPGIPAAQVTLWGIFFLAVHATVGPFIGAANRLQKMLKLYAVLVPVGATVQYGVIKAGFGLTGAAWANVLTLAMVTASELFVAQRECGRSVKQAVLSIVMLHFPLAASIVLAALARSLSLGAGVTELVRIPWEGLLFLMLYLPLFALYEHRFSGVRMLWQGL